MGNEQSLAPVENIKRTIIVIRGQKVILDSDLAALYGVTTKRLNEQVKRNPARFPTDFAFQITSEESDALRSQNATLKKHLTAQLREQHAEAAKKELEFD